MYETPIVSVIIPTYQSSTQLSRAIASVQAQQIDNLEIIIVDDASTDGTQGLLSILSKTDNRVKWFRQEENRGPAAARNRGMLEAHGKYIAFLDADDEWFPGNYIRKSL